MKAIRMEMFGLFVIALHVIAIVGNGNKKNCNLNDSFSCSYINSTLINCDRYILTGINISAGISLDNSNGKLFHDIVIEDVTDNTITTGTCIISKRLKNFRNFKRRKFNCIFYEDNAFIEKNASKIPCYCACEFIYEKEEGEFTSVHPTTILDESDGWAPNLSVDPKPEIGEVSVQVFHKTKFGTFGLCYIRLCPRPVIALSNCSSENSGNCNFSEVEIKDNISKYVFKHVSPGNYRIEVGVQDLNFDDHTHCFTMDKASNQVYTASDTKNNNTITIATLAAFSAVVLCSVMFMCYCCNKKRPNQQSDPEDSHHAKLIGDLQPQKVSIIYHVDNEEFKIVIDKFVAVLKKFFKCSEVLHLDEAGEEEMLKNRQRFIDKVCSKAYKIIIIHSEGAYLCFEAFKEKNDDSLTRNIFLDCLNALMHDAVRISDYNTVINLRFSFTKECHIIKKIAYLTQYEVPEQMLELFNHLHSLPTNEKAFLTEYYYKDDSFKCFCDAVHNIKDKNQQDHHIPIGLRTSQKRNTGLPSLTISPFMQNLGNADQDLGIESDLSSSDQATSPSSIDSNCNSSKSLIT